MFGTISNTSQLMSTNQSQAKKMVATNDSRGEEEDLGALICRESELRKAKAAATAAHHHPLHLGTNFNSKENCC